MVCPQVPRIQPENVPKLFIKMKKYCHRNQDNETGQNYHYEYYFSDQNHNHINHSINLFHPKKIT